MRIACPDCAAAYDVPDAMLSADREVRCARCGRNWAPLAVPAPRSDEVVDAHPEPPPAPPGLVSRGGSQPEAPLPPSSLDGRRLALAWGGSIALLLLAVTGVFLFHPEIAAAWPPAVRLFRTMGLS